MSKSSPETECFFTTEDGNGVSISTLGGGGAYLSISEPYNSLGAILTAVEARRIEDTLRRIREQAEKGGATS